MAEDGDVQGKNEGMLVGMVGSDLNIPTAEQINMVMSVKHDTRLCLYLLLLTTLPSTGRAVVSTQVVEKQTVTKHFTSF